MLVQRRRRRRGRLSSCASFSTLFRVSAGATRRHAPAAWPGKCSFSTLFRVSAGATLRPPARVEEAERFSTLFRVSAGATPGGDILRVIHLLFQYPLSGQCWCNESLLVDVALNIGEFQYPLSGQCWCNADREGGAGAERYVSVPSFGSVLVQQVWQRQLRKRTGCFSTLFRVSAGATATSPTRIAA